MDIQRTLSNNPICSCGSRIYNERENGEKLQKYDSSTTLSDYQCLHRPSEHLE